MADDYDRYRLQADILQLLDTGEYSPIEIYQELGGGVLEQEADDHPVYDSIEMMEDTGLIAPVTDTDGQFAAVNTPYRLTAEGEQMLVLAGYDQNQ